MEVGFNVGMGVIDVAFLKLKLKKRKYNRLLTSCIDSHCYYFRFPCIVLAIKPNANEMYIQRILFYLYHTLYINQN